MFFVFLKIILTYQYNLLKSYSFLWLMLRIVWSMVCIQHNSGSIIPDNGSSLLQFASLILTRRLIPAFTLHVLLTAKILESWEKPAEEKAQGQRASTLACRFTDLSRLYVVEMEKRIGLCLQHHKPFF